MNMQIEGNRAVYKDITATVEPDGSITITHRGAEHRHDQLAAEVILAELGAPQEMLDFIGADLEDDENY